MFRRLLTDEEYREYFHALGGVRGALANDLARAWSGRSIRWIVDLASGHGLFALEVASAFPGASVCATGLPMDKETFLEVAASVRRGNRSSLRFPQDSLQRVRYVEADLTALPFRDGSFDAAVNFLGLEDVRMTRGESGLRRTVREAARVTRRGGTVELAVQVFGDSPSDVLAREIMKYLGHDAVFLDPSAYEGMLEAAGLRVASRILRSTGAVLTASQTKEELRYACEETPRVYRGFGVRTRTLDEVWARFGSRIESHGYALYTDILGILAEKP